jgi:hypothetical protein
MRLSWIETTTLSPLPTDGYYRSGAELALVTNPGFDEGAPIPRYGMYWPPFTSIICPVT